MINAALAYSFRALSEVYQSEDVTLIHGDCPTGADKIGNDIWVAHGLPVERHPADWGTHGKSAGPTRNNHMVSLGADVVLGFPLGDSRGTRGCMRAAADQGLKVVDCTTIDWKSFS